MGDDITPPERPQRRSFTAEYKLAVLTEYDGATDPGEMAACFYGLIATTMSIP